MAMWLQDPRCDEIVQEAWHDGLSNVLIGFAYKLWDFRSVQVSHIVRTYVELVVNICHLKSTNPLKKHTLLVIR